MAGIIQVVTKCIPLLIVLLVLNLPSGAQILHLQGGSSSLIDAHGGSLDFQAPTYHGNIGLGFLNGNLEVGGVIKTTYHGLQLTAGDDTLRFDLPTDIFNESHYFYGRGVGVEGGGETFSYKAFAGATSTAIGAPFFSAARADQPFGLLFGQFQLRPNLKLVSRVIISKRSTFLNGLEWSPSKTLAASIAAGIGSNKPYLANALRLERTRWLLKASYIATDNAFQRLGARTQLLSETDRENILLAVRPTVNSTVSVSRQNILSPVVLGSRSTRGTINQLSANGSLLAVRWNGSVYQSRVSQINSRGYSLSLSRVLTSRLDSGIDFYRSTTKFQLPSQSLTARLHERLTQKIGLTQYFGRSNGQMNLYLGGEFNYNRLSLAISHDTAYAPFRPASAGGPFVRVYNVSLRVRLFGNAEVSGYTNVAPDGRLKYTASAGDYLYRYDGLERSARPNLIIGNYVVVGKVVDEDGKPISGAALEIGGQTAFSNSDGEFMVRFSKRQRVAFKVLLDEFLVAGRYEILKAPATLESAPEDKAKPAMIVLKRDRRTVAPLVP